MNDPHIPLSRPQMLSQIEIDAIAASFNRIYPARVHVPVSVQNGTMSKFINWMLGIVALLAVAGITGQILVYGQVQAMTAKVDILMQERHK